MNYKLDSIPISNYGAMPGRINNFAASGFMDLPRRTGKTEHSWGTVIEPFVEQQDIVFDGRTIRFNAVMKEEKLEAFKQACINCRVFSHDYDSYNVVCRSEIRVIKAGYYRGVFVEFWQNDFSLKPLTFISSNSGEIMIDNFNLIKDFGIYFAKGEGLDDVGKRIEVATTDFYKRTTYREGVDISINCFMIQPSLSNLYNSINQFYSVIMKPGLRVLKIRNKSFNVYFKDGVQVKEETDKTLSFTLKCTVI